MENHPSSEDALAETSDTKKTKSRRRGSEAIIKREIEVPKPPAPGFFEAPKDESKKESEERSWFGSKESKVDDPKSKEDTESPETEVSADESETVDETEAPTDSVGEAEKPDVWRALGSEQKQRNAEAAADTEAPAEAIAGHLLAERLDDLVIEKGDIDAAYEQVVAESGIDAAIVDAIEAETSDTPESDDIDNAVEAEPVPELNEEVVFDRSAEVDGDIEDEDDQKTQAAASHTAGVPPHGTGPTGSGSGGGNAGNNIPPNGPASPFGPNFGGGFGGGGAAGGYNYNQAPPAPATPNTQPPVIIERYHGGNPAGAALVGGIIGYLIGRRRGRIKTEKKLLPVQKKLEAQVNDMYWQLQEKETKLRRVAAEHVRQKGPAAVEKLRPLASPPTERPAETRRLAPEAHQLHGGNKTTERIGHMLIAAEAPLIKRSEKAAPKETISPKAESQRKVTEVEKLRLPADKHVETMNRVELLALSEKIVVDGSSLRQIYETHLVGERGLRRLVTEHLRGGDLKKALRNEIIEREIDFERDPAMRDIAAPASSSNSTGGGKARLDQLVAKAAANVAGSNEEVAYYRARADYDEKLRQEQQTRQHMVDISLTVVITILVGLVVMLYLNHR